MKILVNVILVPLCIILLCAFLYAGIKALVAKMINKFKNAFSHKKNTASGAPTPEAMMNIVTVKAGTCQSCGKTFIGTSEDKNSPLNVVKFMGETRIMCNDCLKKLIEEFNKSHTSAEKQYSTSAQELKELLAKVDNSPRQ